MPPNNGVFPELFIDMGPSAARTTGAVTASPLGQLVDSALREVLAWRPRAGDPKGFVAALNQAFTISEVEGHTEFAWTPRSFTVQADMGAVTGAQASIYARAKAALDQSAPLLEGLYPLRPDDDEENSTRFEPLSSTSLRSWSMSWARSAGRAFREIRGLLRLALGRRRPR